MIYPWTKPKPEARGGSRAAAVAARRTRARAPRRDPRDLVDGLEQRHLDVIGLALIAAAVYLAFVLYLDWDGGRVGGWLAEGLAHAFGQVAYVIPLALAAWGVSLLARPLIEAPSALNAGGILVLAALLLAFAAETAGRRARPAQPPRVLRAEVHDRARRRGRRGPLLGRRRRCSSGSARTSSSVLMFVSGALLLTGTTVASLLARHRPGGAPGGHRHPRRRSHRAHAAPRRAADAWGDAPGDEIAVTRSASRPRPSRPSGSRPTPLDERRDRSRSAPTMTSGPPARSSRRLRYQAAPRTTARTTAEPEVGACGRHADGPAALQGRDHRVRGGRLQAAADEGAREGQGRPGPRHARPRRDRERAARVAAPLRGRGAPARRGQRPAREPLRAPARARDQGLQGRPAQGRPRLRARLHRHPDPGADPRQEGGGRRGPELSAAAWSASATSTPTGPRAPRRSSPGSARTSPARR